MYTTPGPLQGSERAKKMVSMIGVPIECVQDYQESPASKTGLNRRKKTCTFNQMLSHQNAAILHPF